MNLSQLFLLKQGVIMFKVDIRLVKDDWKCDPYEVDSMDLLNVCMVAFSECRRRVGIQGLDILPLGQMEFVLWADGACRGYLGIKDAAVFTGDG